VELFLLVDEQTPNKQTANKRTPNKKTPNKGIDVEPLVFVTR
jgi:hypothetical protein